MGVNSMMMLVGTIGVVIVLENGLLIDTKQRSNEMTLEELKEHYMPIIELAVTRTKEYYEAQLKKYIELGEKQALEFDRFFDAFGLKSENISIDDAINFFKAKDKEIERLKAESKQAYIEGSKSCDDLIRFYITKIEELSK